MIARQLPAARAMAGPLDGDGERPLQAEQRRHQLAPQPHHHRPRQRPAVAGDQPAQDGRLARRPQEDWRGGGHRLGLEPADALGDFRPLDQQVVKRIVDGVDPAAQVVDRIVGGSHGGRAVVRNASDSRSHR